MSKTNPLDEVFQAFNEILEDNTVPRSTKQKIEEIVGMLKDENTELSLRQSKVMYELEQMVEDVNLQPFVRTQIYNVVGLLERC